MRELFHFKEKLPGDKWDDGNELFVQRDPDGTLFVKIGYGNARYVSVRVAADQVPTLLGHIS